MAIFAKCVPIMNCDFSKLFFSPKWVGILKKTYFKIVIFPPMSIFKSNNKFNIVA